MPQRLGWGHESGFVQGNSTHLSGSLKPLGRGSCLLDFQKPGDDHHPIPTCQASGEGKADLAGGASFPGKTIRTGPASAILTEATKGCPSFLMGTMTAAASITGTSPYGSD